jgi:hypothetical protein
MCTGDGVGLRMTSLPKIRKPIPTAGVRRPLSDRSAGKSWPNGSGTCARRLANVCGSNRAVTSNGRGSARGQWQAPQSFRVFSRQQRSGSLPTRRIPCSPGSAATGHAFSPAPDQESVPKDLRGLPAALAWGQMLDRPRPAPSARSVSNFPRLLR